MTKDNEFKLPLGNGETALITHIGDVVEDGTMPIDYVYKGNLPTDEVEKIISTKINKIIELAVYGEKDD